MKNFNMRSHVLLGIFGLAMGFGLYRIGFSDFGEVHRLFTFADLRLLLTFMGAVVFAGVGFQILARGKTIPPKKFMKGTIPGGILFGVGWALTGACPSIALVQLGEGRIPALATVAGILAGTWIFRVLRPRFFPWDSGSCNF